MKIEPVKNSKSPVYPSLYASLKNPDLLRKNVPFSWRCKSVVLGALSAFVMAGCSPQKTDVHPAPRQPIKAPVQSRETVVKTPEIEKIEEAVKKQPSIVKESDKPLEAATLKVDVKTPEKSPVTEDVKPGLIAPIFAHGRGSGNTGMTMSPPVEFISEDEARRIIEDEFRKGGLEFNNSKTKKLKITVPKINADPKSKGKPPRNKFYSFTTDGFDEEMNLAFEYISWDDYRNMIYNRRFDFNIYASAEHIRGYLAKQKINSNVVIFYDPVYIHNFGVEQVKRTDPIFEKNLRNQVKDFIVWAEKKGIIDQINSNKGD